MLPERLAYKGMMLSGVPNMAFTIGYTNASWTLKADLVAEFVCRLLERMDREGQRECVPVDDGTVERRPLLDFSAGYVQRSIHEFPKGGAQRAVAARHELRAGRDHIAPPQPGRWCDALLVSCLVSLTAGPGRRSAWIPSGSYPSSRSRRLAIALREFGRR